MIKDDLERIEVWVPCSVALQAAITIPGIPPGGVNYIVGIEDEDYISFYTTYHHTDVCWVDNQAYTKAQVLRVDPLGDLVYLLILSESLDGPPVLEMRSKEVFTLEELESKKIDEWCQERM